MASNVTTGDPETAAKTGGANTESLARIVDTLEEDIVFGRLHQNERLIEDDLMARFGVKRHVIRQTLADLERIGIVERIPNRGSRVRAFSPEIINQLYVVRELLETSAVRLVPFPLPAGTLDRLRAVQDVHDKAVDEEDLHRVFRSNIEFHRTLFELCNNPFLAATINEYAFRTHGIRFYSMTSPADLQRARAEHHQMIEALEYADRDNLIEICKRHLLPAKERYLRMARAPSA